MSMSNDTRINVQSTCPHGVFPGGTVRWLLTHNPAGLRTIETSFAGPKDLTLTSAVMQIEGRTPFPHELDRGWWKLQRNKSPGMISIGEHLREKVEWQGPSQTAGVCDLCAIDVVKEEK